MLMPRGNIGDMKVVMTVGVCLTDGVCLMTAMW